MQRLSISLNNTTDPDRLSSFKTPLCFSLRVPTALSFPYTTSFIVHYLALVRPCFSFLSLSLSLSLRFSNKIKRSFRVAQKKRKNWKINGGRKKRKKEKGGEQKSKKKKKENTQFASSEFSKRQRWSMKGNKGGWTAVQILISLASCFFLFFYYLTKRDLVMNSRVVDRPARFSSHFFAVWKCIWKRPRWERLPSVFPFRKIQFLFHTYFARVSTKCLSYCAMIADSRRELLQFPLDDKSNQFVRIGIQFYKFDWFIVSMIRLKRISKDKL